eukprot:711677-Prorocentrum_minimum.AAC.1
MATLRSSGAPMATLRAFHPNRTLPLSPPPLLAPNPLSSPTGAMTNTSACNTSACNDSFPC